VYTSHKAQQQPSNSRRDDKKVDARQVNPQPSRPVPLDPSLLSQVGGGNGSTAAPGRGW
jgi:hypothetical protein